MRADGLKDRNDEANGRFSKFANASKTISHLTICRWHVPQHCTFHQDTSFLVSHVVTPSPSEKCALLGTSLYETEVGSGRSLKTNFNKKKMSSMRLDNFNPYPTAFPYGNGMVLHFYQQQESSTTKTVHRIINKRLKAYV